MASVRMRWATVAGAVAVVSLLQLQAQGEPIGYGLMVLDPSAVAALYLSGTGSSPALDVQAGGIQVNSASARAVCHSGSRAVQAAVMNVVGGVDNNFQTQVHLNCPLNLGAPLVPDPLAFLRNYPLSPSSFPNQQSVVISSSGNQTLNPGYYPQPINKSGGTLTLNPGIYVLGNGFDITGNASVQGQGVLIYLLSGPLYVGTAAAISLTEYAGGYGDGLYDGLAIWQAYGNDTDAAVLGTADVDVRGTLYFPECGITLAGSADTLCTQLIVSELEISGLATVRIDYDGRHAVSMMADVNLDGTVDSLDISPFVHVLTTGDYQIEADCNWDGAVNALDIIRFVTLLTGDSGAVGGAAVPEPATLTMLTLAALSLSRRRASA